jgi:hypothetical protein
MALFQTLAMEYGCSKVELDEVVNLAERECQLTHRLGQLMEISSNG